MSNMKNPYTATNLEPNDIMAYTIKVHIQHVDADDVLIVKAYKCQWDHPEIGEDGSPQGSPIFLSVETLKDIFPILNNYEIKVATF